MDVALYLLLTQGALGAFDTLFYHEWLQRLPARPTGRTELRLHASRDFAYALIYGSLAWVQWHGWLVWLLGGVLLLEILITLWDFIEEDRVRPLPPGERITHTIMAILYGGFLAFLVPQMVSWSHQPTQFAPISYGWVSWLMAVMAVGVFGSGVRDLLASFPRKGGRVGSILLLTVAALAMTGSLLADRFTRESPNYSRIESGLYLGGFVSQPPRGTRAVLNLCESEDPYSAEVHRWEPIRDGEPAPDLDWLRRQVEFIDTQRTAGLPVFVHCRNGVSRSGLVVTAYLMHSHGWKRDEALEFVRGRRAGVRPNPVFMRLLLAWEQSQPKDEP